MNSSPSQHKPAFDIEIRNCLLVLDQNLKNFLIFCKSKDILDVSLSSFQILNLCKMTDKKTPNLLKKSKRISNAPCKNSRDSSNIPEFGQTCQKVSNLAQKIWNRNPAFRYGSFFVSVENKTIFPLLFKVLWV